MPKNEYRKVQPACNACGEEWTILRICHVSGCWTGSIIDDLESPGKSYCGPHAAVIAINRLMEAGTLAEVGLVVWLPPQKLAEVGNG